LQFRVLSAISADPPIQVLLVDDEPRLRAFLKEELEAENYCVTTAVDAAGAWELLDQISPPDLLVLDWNLPDGSGPELCQRMRNAGITLPVLMLTGHDDVTDRVHALDAGVDDYLVKPFSVDELLARLRALQRRRWEVEPAPPDQLLQLAGLELNLTAGTASLDGEPLALLKKEFDLLQVLMRADQEVCVQADLLAAVWGLDNFDGVDLLEVYVESLQGKLRTSQCSLMIEPCDDGAWRLIKPVMAP
jgi:DNA-binding response OmpR family regulator